MISIAATSCAPHLAGETVRGFWHGYPLTRYQLLSLASFVVRGHTVEVFTYDQRLNVPGWVTRRDAREILPTEHVLRYQVGPGKGSPALHANLFRYVLLHRLGGWWVDLDVILLTPDIPRSDMFFANDGDHFNNAIIKFPPEQPLLVDAIERCLAVGERAIWAQTGPVLLTELIDKYGLTGQGAPSTVAYPIFWSDVCALFDPAQCDGMRELCGDAVFLHCFNEIWRRARLPTYQAPPKGSFLESVIADLGLDMRFIETMEFPDVKRALENI